MFQSVKTRVAATPHVNIYKVERHRLDASLACATNTRTLFALVSAARPWIVLVV